MAIATTAFTHTSAAPVSNAGVVPVVAIPDNCREIIIQNSTANQGFVAQAAAATVLTVTNSILVNAGTTVVLSAGTIKQRGSLDPAASVNGLVYGMTGGGTMTITYVNLLGAEQ